MRLNVMLTAGLLAFISLAIGICTGEAGSSSSSAQTSKKSDAGKDEKANAKLPPCGACNNLVTSFEQVCSRQLLCL